MIFIYLFVLNKIQFRIQIYLPFKRNQSDIWIKFNLIIVLEKSIHYLILFCILRINKYLLDLSLAEWLTRKQYDLLLIHPNFLLIYWDHYSMTWSKKRLLNVALNQSILYRNLLKKNWALKCYFAWLMSPFYVEWFFRLNMYLIVRRMSHYLNLKQSLYWVDLLWQNAWDSFNGEFFIESEVKQWDHPSPSSSPSLLLFSLNMKYRMSHMSVRKVFIHISYTIQILFFYTIIVYSLKFYFIYFGQQHMLKNDHRHSQYINASFSQ